MIYSELTERSLKFMHDLYHREVSDAYVYHSFQHTKDVLENSILIARELALSEEETELLCLAAIFHDSGYSGGHENHEQRSVEIAMDFLKESTIDNLQRDVIYDAILSTKVPQNPKSQLAKILCDADLMYLSSDDFLETALLLLEEWRLTGREHISIKKFYELSIDFLNKHQYHTDYGRKTLEKGKIKNERLLHLLIKDL